MKPQSLEAELLYPTLLALDALGGSGRIDEINTWVIEHERFSEEVTSPIQGKGPQSVFEYRMAWAHTILKQLGLVASGGRTVWIITEAGMKEIEKPNPRVSLRELNRSRRQPARVARKSGAVLPAVVSANLGSEALFSFDDFALELEEEASWKSALLQTIMALSPRGFEHLTLRLLREHGIEDVEVSGGPSDGGIDGDGVMRLGLLRFPVVFNVSGMREAWVLLRYVIFVVLCRGEPTRVC